MNVIYKKKIKKKSVHNTKLYYVHSCRNIKKHSKQKQNIKKTISFIAQIASYTIFSTII